MSQEYVPSTRATVFGGEAWTSEDRFSFCDMIADGLSISEAGRRLKRTTKSAHAYFHRIRQQMGWQAQ